MVALAILGLVAPTVGFSGQAAGDDDACTVTVTAPASIQAAVDAAGGGDVICLTGEFHQSVVISASDIRLRGDSGIFDGHSPADAGTTLDGDYAIRLTDGVSHVTIENLEMRDYNRPRGSAIQAWDVATSHITVKHNYMHDNAWNGVLVGSEGGFVHEKWKVEENRVENNGFAGIELTNCSNCKIEENDLGGNAFNIVIQARNTVPGSGLVSIDKVKVEENNVVGGWFGIYVLAFTGHPTDFTPITGTSAHLSRVKIEENTFTDSGSYAIIYWAYNDATLAEKGKIVENDIYCTPAGGVGIAIYQSGSSGQTGTVQDTKVLENTIDSDCNPGFVDYGQNTKFKPAHGEQESGDSDDA